jgi:hypothetical protein
MGQCSGFIAQTMSQALLSMDITYDFLVELEAQMT